MVQVNFFCPEEYVYSSSEFTHFSFENSFIKKSWEPSKWSRVDRSKLEMEEWGTWLLSCICSQKLMSIHVAFEGVLLQYAKVLMSEH